jgi:hypothetical protein
MKNGFSKAWKWEQQVFPRIGKGHGTFVQGLEKRTENFPSLGTGTAFGPNWHEVSQ